MEVTTATSLFVKGCICVSTIISFYIWKGSINADKVTQDSVTTYDDSGFI